MEYILRVQQLGAYPLAVYQHWRKLEYITPKELFPLIPPIIEISPKQRTEEDKEKWRQEFLMKIMDNSLNFSRRPQIIKKSISEIPPNQKSW